MLLFELIVGLLLAGALFSLLANRIGVPYPALLALVGAIIALVPGVPGVVLDPELALALFVAPTLLDAAYDASPRDLRDNLASVTSLAVVLVLLTVAAVAWAAHAVVPGLGWAPAIALGAIVAPPDASAATAVLRRLKPPHRLLVILEGESLFNDATSLLVYRVAVGAAMTGAWAGWKVLPLLFLTCGGGVLAGWILARLFLLLIARVEDIPVTVLLQFLGTFAVWILADRVGLSAIITMVAYAMTLARRVGGQQNARRKIASYAVWEVAVLVLNVLAFVLIGLQLRGIATRVHGAEWRTFGLAAAAVCAAVVLVRVAWVSLFSVGLRWKRLRFGNRGPRRLGIPTFGSVAVASWCGMRGIVTLAAALALPAGADAFPHRDLIVFCAFCVVLATLVLQGSTLAPLMRRLCLHDDGTVEQEITVARVETARAALRSLDGEAPEPPHQGLLRREYEARLRAAASAGSAERSERTLAALQRRAVLAQRVTLAELRAKQVIGDDALHAVEEELDVLELTADEVIRPTVAAEAPEARAE